MTGTIFLILGLGVGYATARLHNKGYIKTGNLLFGSFVLGLLIWLAVNLYLAWRSQ
jgi:hypothetical protein